MRIYSFQPSLYDNPLVIFNYCIQSLLKEVFIKNRERIQEFDNFEVLDFERDLMIVNVTKDIIDLEDNKSQNYLSELYRASSNNGVFANIRGNNSFSYAETLSKYTDYSVDYIFKIYKENFSIFEDDQKLKYEKELSLLIPKLYDFSIKNKQFKKDDNAELKGYCDLDFYSYIYNDVFMIACYASATMYAIKFTENGFKVYGENNDYGKEIELNRDPEFDWDNTNFEDYFLKHLNENMLIFEVNSNKPTSYNELISMFHNIVNFICKEEKIIEVVDANTKKSIIFEDEDNIEIKIVRR